MKILNSINQTYLYFSYVYNLTKSEYIKEKLIKSEDLKGLNPKVLVKHNFLTEYNETCKWKGVTPQYFHAYNYYNAVRGIKRTYEDILKVLKNSENYDLNEIVEALTIKGACSLHNPEKNEIITTYENQVIETSDYKIHKAIKAVSASEISLIEKVLTPEPEKFLIENEMLKTISNKFDLFLADNAIIKELLGDVVENAMTNTTSIKNSQNSLSTVIAILKTNQDNLFDISASQYYIIRELYANLIEKHPNNDDPKIKERIDKTGVALQKMKERVNNNVTIVNKYGNIKR